MAQLPKEKNATKPRTKRVVFSVRAEPGSVVGVSGDFNNWAPEGKPMSDKMGDGLFKTTVNLAPGVYEYKFVINGTWCVDPECKEWVQNSLGTLNSVLRVE
ncbi:MAG: glycogen-binding domain-containing protein [Kiritimatiellae bacterium]|nr:glycogen-binding domain-containing protein [Kiritimatiellia bacterium]